MFPEVLEAPEVLEVPEGVDASWRFLKLLRCLGFLRLPKFWRLGKLLRHIDCEVVKAPEVPQSSRGSWVWGSQRSPEIPAPPVWTLLDLPPLKSSEVISVYPRVVDGPTQEDGSCYSRILEVFHRGRGQRARGRGRSCSRSAPLKSSEVISFHPESVWGQGAGGREQG